MESEKKGINWAQKAGYTYTVGSILVGQSNNPCAVAASAFFIAGNTLLAMKGQDKSYKRAARSLFVTGAMFLNFGGVADNISTSMFATGNAAAMGISLLEEGKDKPNWMNKVIANGPLVASSVAAASRLPFLGKMIHDVSTSPSSANICVLSAVSVWLCADVMLVVSEMKSAGAKKEAKAPEVAGTHVEKLQQKAPQKNILGKGLLVTAASLWFVSASSLALGLRPMQKPKAANDDKPKMPVAERIQMQRAEAAPSQSALAR